MSLAKSVRGAVFSGIAAFERLTSSRHSASTGDLKNFLLLQHPTALGTAVHATPLVPALRSAIPDCRIAVVASGLALQVFQNNPGVDSLIETPSPIKDRRGATASLRAQNPFPGEPFAILSTLGNERTLIAMQTLSLGNSTRIGFTEAPQLFRKVLHFDPAVSLIDNNLRIVASLGHPFQHFEPQMFPSPSDHEWANHTLAASGVQPGQVVAIFVTQTSPTQRKSWRPERFQAAAHFLIEQYGAHIVFVGTANEADAIETMRAGITGPTTSVAGKTTLPQMAALFSRSSLGLTLDTGALHIGRTVGLPMVVIAPAWSPPLEWLPLNNPRYRILKNLDMVGSPPDYIIDEVSVEEVKAELQSLIRDYPTKPVD